MNKVCFKKLELDGTWYSWVAVGFGAGLSPVAPGTVGTLVAVPVVIFFQFLSVTFWILATVFTILLSVWSASRVSRETATKDHPSIVIDEVAGYVVTMLMISVTWWSIIIGFVFFRIFDILKPPPVDWLDRKISGELVITADGVGAGLYANIETHAKLYFFQIV